MPARAKVSGAPAAICGVYKPTDGKVILKGQEVQGLPAHKMARMGIARTFQISKPLADLTILDNVIAAAGVHEYTGMRSYFRKSHTKEVVDKAEAVLTETGLIKLRDKKASDVSLGYLRRLEIARVLVTEPELIMLDEPCAGLSNFAINEVTELVMKLKAQKKSIVLIEHRVFSQKALAFSIENICPSHQLRLYGLVYEC